MKRLPISQIIFSGALVASLACVSAKAQAQDLTNQQEVKTYGNFAPSTDMWPELNGVTNPYDSRSGHPRHHKLGMITEKFGFFHSDPDDPGRYKGAGNPLFGTSWRNRPYHADYFLGALLMGDLSSDIQQKSAAVQGFRLGYDFDHYWGSEIRFASADSRLSYASDATVSGTNSTILFDTSLKYYPWGDSEWRPYGSFGLGMATFDYQDVTGIAQNETLLGIPIGVGIKYYLKPWMIFRAEITDNITVGSTTTNSMNNFSFTGGFEYRFGGTRPSYTR